MAFETELAAWPYEQADGEPLTGYQHLDAAREAAARFVNASAAEVALTQNATMGMNFLANGLDLVPGDEVVSTDQEHGGGIYELGGLADGLVCAGATGRAGRAWVR